ncbi:MAG: glycosyltransferase family 2 protein [Anaerolinea sp.]|nr:glycosyltransferase family 2 protein [Anaerolinea sp.]
MKHITIVTPCFNELENVEPLHDQIAAVMATLPNYTYDHLYIDNASTDGTDAILRRLAAQDPHVRVIFNTRNFGHIRSPYHGLLQGEGDAVICMASDLQDPPALIPQFIARWEEGYKVVMGVKSSSQETPLFYFLRTAYYRILHSLSDVDLIEHFTGFGLYDRTVIQTLRQIRDPYPYFRGLIAELGYKKAIIPFEQPRRVRGLTKNNFYTLYDMAMLGLTNYSKVPLRMATMLGFGSALVSFLVGLAYLIYKLIAWQNFSLGLAPVIVGLFFFGSVQLIFLGILGEYIGAIYTQVLNRPLVIEQERINFPPRPTDGV